MQIICLAQVFWWFSAEIFRIFRFFSVKCGKKTVGSQPNRQLGMVMGAVPSPGVTQQVLQAIVPRVKKQCELLLQVTSSHGVTIIHTHIIYVYIYICINGGRYLYYWKHVMFHMSSLVFVYEFSSRFCAVLVQIPGNPSRILDPLGAFLLFWETQFGNALIFRGWMMTL